MNTNIVGLRDTHWISSDLRSITAHWNDESFISGPRTNARGFAILLKNNFEYQILKTECLSENLMTLTLKIANDFVLKIVNVYAPNNDDPEFFEVINQHIAKADYDYILICGET